MILLGRAGHTLDLVERERQLDSFLTRREPSEGAETTSQLTGATSLFLRPMGGHSPTPITTTLWSWLLLFSFFF